MESDLRAHAVEIAASFYDSTELLHDELRDRIEAFGQWVRNAERQPIRALIAKWREEARLVRPLECAPVSAEKRERTAKWMFYTNRANELAAAIGEGADHAD